MSKAILLIFLFLFYPGSVVIADEPAKERIINLASNLLNNLQTVNDIKIKNFLSVNIQLKLFNQQEILSLADDMMTGKISVSEYILKITGHNLRRFLDDKIKLIQFGKIEEYGIDKSSNDEKIKGNFYYIKFKVTYKINNKLIDNKLIEIDIINENDSLKIFGFLI